MARPPAGTATQGADGPLIPVLAVVGVGLIGGSAALALRQAGQVGRVLGVGRNAQSLARAQELGLIDAAATPQEAAAQADLVLLATPVRSEEHTSELQSLMRISYAVFCLKKKNNS